jgi:hypothetical protein
MGGGQIFLKNHCAALFNEDLSNEPNFVRIHLAGQPFNAPKRRQMLLKWESLPYESFKHGLQI